MGLDMYLYKNSSKYRMKDGSLAEGMENVEFDRFGCTNRVTIVSNVMYWRKANAIHDWFVQNVQSGVDDCNEYDVSKEDIRKLIGCCQDVLNLVDGMELTVPKENEENFRKWTEKLTPKAKKLYGKKSIKLDAKKLSTFKGLTSYHVVPDAIAGKMSAILPTREGFFFGGTGYDGMYLDDIVTTIKGLKRVLADKELDKGGCWLTYRASW